MPPYLRIFFGFVISRLFARPEAVGTPKQLLSVANHLDLVPSFHLGPHLLDAYPFVRNPMLNFFALANDLPDNNDFLLILQPKPYPDLIRLGIRISH